MGFMVVERENYLLLVVTTHLYHVHILNSFRNLNFKLDIQTFYISYQNIKVHIFWEGHRILRNLPQLFGLCTASQIIGEDMNFKQGHQNEQISSFYIQNKCNNIDLWERLLLLAVFDQSNLDFFLELNPTFFGSQHNFDKRFENNNLKFMFEWCMYS